MGPTWVHTMARSNMNKDDSNVVFKVTVEGLEHFVLLGNKY